MFNFVIRNSLTWFKPLNIAILQNSPLYKRRPYLDQVQAPTLIVHELHSLHKEVMFQTIAPAVYRLSIVDRDVDTNLTCRLN